MRVRIRRGTMVRLEYSAISCRGESPQRNPLSSTLVNQCVRSSGGQHSLVFRTSEPFRVAQEWPTPSQRHFRSSSSRPLLPAIGKRALPVHEPKSTGGAEGDARIEVDPTHPPRLGYQLLDSSNWHNHCHSRWIMSNVCSLSLGRVATT